MVGVEPIYINEPMIAEYFHKKLIEKGYVPVTDELFDLAEIMFDFLLHKSVILDYEEYESEGEDE